MTPNSGTISMDQVRTELGVGSGSIGLGSSGVRLYAFVPTGPIKMSDLYAMARDYYTATNNNSITMKARATQLGWNGTAVLKYTLQLASGVAINGGVLTGSTFPTGSKLQLLNGGTIRGNGGFYYSGSYYDGYNGDAGGPGITMNYALSINNSAGIIGGGGGSGGSGAGDGYNYGGYQGGYSGAGAGNPAQLSNSGASGGNSSTGLVGGTGGSAGQTGGAGGGSASYPNGAGGGGGGLGAAGGAGGRSAFYFGGSGGGAGACTSGSATYATWVNTGTRYGTIG